jgi:hypothetical protein
MKNRKQLPPFGYLSNTSIDVRTLIEYLGGEGLLDFDNYNHIQLDKSDLFEGFVKASNQILTEYFKEDTLAPWSEKFKQIQLTRFDESKSRGPVEFKNTSFTERIRRQDPSHPGYIPEADELNYGVRSELVKGEIEKIFDMFTSKITRARLTFLDAHHDIKPHIDYDTTLVCRYHIPILTNSEVKFFIQSKNIVHEFTMPADGRIFFFNQGLKHWVKNDSDYPRLHLIIDVHGQTELEHMIPLDTKQYPAV